MRMKSDENTPSQLHNESILKSSPMELNDDMPQQLENESIRRMSIKSSSNSRSISPPPALSPAFMLTDTLDPSSSIFVNNMIVNEVGLEEEEEAEEEDVKPEPSKKKPVKKKARELKGDQVRLFDHNAPKQVKSAYVFFMKDRRSSITNFNNKTQQEVLSAIAAEWKTLSEEERKPFELLSAEDKKRKDQEVKEYMKTSAFADFQKKKAKLAGKNRKRKGEAVDEEPAKIQVFPSTSTFCPLLNDSSMDASSSSSSKNVTFSGPVFNPQFISYNKARDSYRRQMQIERSGLEKELEALHDHDPEVKLKNQKDEIKEIDKKLAYIMRTMGSVLDGVNAAQSHLSDVESITEWLETVASFSATNSTKKAVLEAASKYGNKSTKK